MLTGYEAEAGTQVDRIGQYRELETSIATITAAGRVAWNGVVEILSCSPPSHIEITNYRAYAGWSFATLAELREYMEEPRFRLATLLLSAYVTETNGAAEVAAAAKAIQNPPGYGRWRRPADILGVSAERSGPFGGYEFNDSALLAAVGRHVAVHACAIRRNWTPLDEGSWVNGFTDNDVQVAWARRPVVAISEAQMDLKQETFDRLQGRFDQISGLLGKLEGMVPIYPERNDDGRLILR